MKLNRIKVPIVIEMVFDENEAPTKQSALEQLTSICSDDSGIVVNLLEEVDIIDVNFEPTTTEQVPELPKIDQAVNSIIDTIPPTIMGRIVVSLEAREIQPSNMDGVKDAAREDVYSYAREYLWQLFYDKLSHFIPIDEEI